MGKRGKSKRLGKSTGALKQNGSLRFKDETPDSGSRSFYFDEVDEFHQSREKAALDRVGRRKRQQLINDGTEEVFRVRPESDDDEEDEDEIEESEGEDSDMASDIYDKKQEEDYLPSADAWGKRRKDYYDTDYVDEDYGGFSGSDAEAAELEEEEALRLQRKMKENMREEDFIIDFQEDPALKEGEEQAKKEEVVSEKSGEEKQVEMSSEVKQLVKEYNKKRNVLVKKLQPILNGVKEGKVPRNSGINLILAKLEIYSNYLINIQFYLYLRTKTQVNTENHPVLESIIQWKELVTKIDEQTEGLKEEIDFVIKKLKKGENLRDFLAPSPENPTSVRQEKEGRKKKKRRIEEIEEEPVEEGVGDVEEDFEENIEEEKRGINYEMAKNKGLTPHRKKEQRNPRVKHRGKYRKALIRKRGQIPDVKKELSRYGGESRGMKIGVVKNTKLAPQLEGMTPTPSPPLPPGYRFQGAPVMMHSPNGVLSGIQHGMFVPPHTHPQFPLPYNAVVAQPPMRALPPPTDHQQAIRPPTTLYNSYTCIPKLSQPSPLSGSSLQNEEKFQYNSVSKKPPDPIGTKPAPSDSRLISADSHTQTNRRNTAASDLFKKILKDKDTYESLLKTDPGLFRELVEFVIDSK